LTTGRPAVSSGTADDTLSTRRRRRECRTARPDGPLCQVWSYVYDLVSEETKPKLTAYRVRWADGQVRGLPLTFQNVRDPYRQMGQLFRGIAPNIIGTTMLVFPHRRGPREVRRSAGPPARSMAVHGPGRAA
jgi:hypothetical protein